MAQSSAEEALLDMLHSRGYTIVIELKDNSKYVTFKGKYSAESYTNPTCYSTKFTDHEIKLDCVYKLLQWTGLRVISTLDY